MKPKILTQHGTVPIFFKEGRKKPFRLRVGIGGKRVEKYYATRAEAEIAWQKLAPLASQPTPPVVTALEKSLLGDQELAEYLHLRARLAYLGMTMSEAVTIALNHRAPADQNNAVPDTAPPIWLEHPSLAEQIKLTSIATQTIAQQVERIANRPQMPPRVIRSISAAARYCGFKQTKLFFVWAARVGLVQPVNKRTKQERIGFLIEELDAAIVRDPSLCRTKQRLPKF